MEPEGPLPCSQKPTSGPLLSQMHPVHAFQPHFPTIHSNIILSSTPMSSAWSLQVFQPKSCMHFSCLVRASSVIRI